MHRREILTLLAASADVPVAGLDLLWHGMFSQVDNTSLSSLERITTVLASEYHTSPPETLLGSVMGHLEKASRMLRVSSMKPIQRQRLESIVVDNAIFVGSLSVQTGKFSQADAYYGLAEKMARQASNMTLLAQVRAEQALLDYYEQSPDQANTGSRHRVTLLEEAQALATRHAPAIVQMAVNSWLAEDKALAKDGYGADEALERSQRALEKARMEGPVGKGFVSSAGNYSDEWGEGKLEGFRGTVELSLGRTSAINIITNSLRLKTNAHSRAIGLADLAIALIACEQPDQACACLSEAHVIGRSEGSAIILHHVFRARALMPREWNRLRCVRELDERLRAGWITVAPSQA
jgi:hypothetical protein